MPTVTPGVVSVVLVNFRGTDDTLEAIAHLRKLDWPAELLEIVVVENGSGDDSAARLKAVEGITLVVSKTNDGFAGGCNLGVSKSRGEYVALLNNDAKPDPGWIRAAVARFEQSPTIGAVASRVLDWDGELVDYIGSAMTWYGMGYKPFTAETIPVALSMQPKDVLFGTGSAMFVRRSVYEELGGFDERYFMFFEDVDLGWRLNLAGYRFAYEPASLAYHKHHASMSAFGSHKETYLLERNALYTLYKNIGEESVGTSLQAAMALSIRRAITRGELDSTSLDLRKGGSDDPTMSVPSQLVAATFAIDQFTEHLPGLTKSREQIQSSRQVSEAHIWRLFGDADAPVYQADKYLKGYDKIVTAFDVSEPPTGTRVVIVTGDPIGAKLAGPAIRAWNMAELLSRTASVTLVSLTGVEPVSAPFEVVHIRPGDDRSFGKLEAAADVIVFQGHAMAVFDTLRTSTKILVVDIYDPMHLEQLEQGRELPAAQWSKQVTDATDTLNEQIERGDFFLCASDRQRLFWLGQLAGLGRINPETYTGDPDLEGLIAVAPFGLSSTPPAHHRDVLKGVLPGIGRDDKVLLWSGGLYNWFDPKTLIRAVARVSRDHDSVKLFFQGTKHPHPGVPEMEIVAQSRDLARDLGVLDSAVFFNASWVDYAERGNYLLEADAGVSTHFSHIETTFSFRTRILDYLWAELPMVVTEGDHFAELVEKEGLGIVVPAQDVDALAAALERVLFDTAFIAKARKNIRRVRERYYWEAALAPLVDFVADPHHAGDNRHFADGATPAARPRQRKRRTGLAKDLSLVTHYLKNGGPRVVISKIRGRLGRG